MTWIVDFYNDDVFDDTVALPRGVREKFLMILNMIESQGPSLGMPYTKKMEPGLFEIRAKGKEGIARVFYCTIHGSEVILLHSFIKKTQKTPTKDLNTARKRMKEVKSEWAPKEER